jgi:DNA-binding transcriptional ArsR family regulator
LLPNGSEKKGGRKKASFEEPELVETLREIVEVHTAGSPVEPGQLWTNRSPSELADELSTAGERCVCELTGMIGSDMSTVSRHLAVLKGAGLVEDEKRGQMVFYRLRMKCILSFFDCIESVMACNAKSQQELLA